ncbi:hypothetical protein [Streptomyces sp. NPDC001816]|uniref:hypothetical protein n=1 Tax=Streptomyces sp. NPDC001816 TaxID=3364612 RepID=UPI0036B8E1CB
MRQLGIADTWVLEPKVFLAPFSITKGVGDLQLAPPGRADRAHRVVESRAFIGHTPTAIVRIGPSFVLLVRHEGVAPVPSAVHVVSMR